MELFDKGDKVFPCSDRDNERYYCCNINGIDWVNEPFSPIFIVEENKVTLNHLVTF